MSSSQQGSETTAPRAGQPGVAPVPKVLRSLQALPAAAPSMTLPITQNGTTYEMAQEVRWLDGQHFAVGRWDGSMSIFQFETAQYVGPLINAASNDPSKQGVQMVANLPGAAIASSNGPSSLALWHASGRDWSGIQVVATASYDASLGTASSGVCLRTGATNTLVVGHISGTVSIWSYDQSAQSLTFLSSVNVQNPKPVNPFNDHTIEDVVVADQANAVVAAGSEDGYVTMLQVPSGKILSQTVFNPAAQRGINAIAIEGDRLLVANCAVGPTDHNFWYYSIDRTNWSITLLDQVNLVLNTSLPQVFNFDTVWGRNAGKLCWFASTEEGALWMGTPSATALNPIGYLRLTGPLGSALDYRQHQLAMVSYDLYQFSTS
ncbi:MAG TPA: hypothetical protein VH298_12865 [Jatrophihabitans sp.]|jgi:hypothetical protein|nr:hypothetical protein [Jatrophihabitans sp.]